jgi:hypothetical protein
MEIKSGFGRTHGLGLHLLQCSFGSFFVVVIKLGLGSPRFGMV